MFTNSASLFMIPDSAFLSASSFIMHNLLKSADFGYEEILDIVAESCFESQVRSLSFSPAPSSGVQFVGTLSNYRMAIESGYEASYPDEDASQYGFLQVL